LELAAKIKTCRTCTEEKPLTEFYINSGRWAYPDCKPCHRAGPRRKWQLKQYGLTPESYAAMFAEQNGVCKICNQVCATGRNLAVDHNHTTGVVRGLLCKRCNQVLGQVEENLELLAKVVDYLRSADADS